MAAQLPSGVPLSEIPAGVPPPGVTPDFAHPSPSLQPAIIAVSVVFMAFGLLFAAVSFLQHRRDAHATDWIMVAASFLCVPQTGLVISLSPYAVHTWDISVATISQPRYYKLAFTLSVFNVVSIFLAKLAIIALYLQVFDSGLPYRINPVPIACYVAIFINVCAYLPSFISTFAFLTPGSGRSWGIDMSGHVAKDVTFGLVRSVIGTVLDIYLFILPIRPVAKLKMDKKKKLGILIIFGTALLGVVASVLSLAFVTIADRSPDPLWYYGAVELCNAVETWVAIIVASMPGFAAACAVSLPVFAEKLSTAMASLLRSGSHSGESVRGGLAFASGSGSLSEVPPTHNQSKDSQTGQAEYEITRQIELVQVSQRV